MAEAIASADADTLLVFDTDSTLIKSAQMLGGEAWVHEIMAKRSENEDPRAAIERFEAVYPIWAKVQSSPGSSQLIESGTPALIRAKTKRVGAKALVLSLAMSQFMKGRKQQLESLGFRFAESAPVPGDLRLDAEGRVLYSEGIILASFGDKGSSLVEFLHQARRLIGYRPKRVIFVDDKREHVESVHRALELEGIEHLCYRYGAVDGLYATYRPEIAAAQLQAIQGRKPRLLSDQEASRLSAPKARMRAPARPRRQAEHAAP